MLAKIRTVLSNRTTYKLGMLQTRVYRMLNLETTKALAPYGLTPPEWAMLGVLHDMPEGVRYSTVADEVGVEPPFVTLMAKKLIKKGLAQDALDPKDSRAKLIRVTAKGKTLVPGIEKEVRSAMRPLVDGISPKDLLTYFTVLHTLAYKAEKIKKQSV